MTRSVREVYPTFGPPHLLGPEHRLPKSLDCWCRPRLVTPCTECGDGTADPDCWRCSGEGTIAVEYDDGVAPVIIVHNCEADLT